MQCPACQGTLAQKRQADLVIDLCEQGCGGIWFDNFELKKVDEAHEAAGEALLGMGSHKPVSGDRAAKRLCPKCAGTPMRRYFFSVRKGIELDECPACGGVWLDAGELAALRSEFKTAQERTQAFDEHFSKLFGEQLAEEHAKGEAELARAKKFAHALRFICPSYWIPGKQRGAAF